MSSSLNWCKLVWLCSSGIPETQYFRSDAFVLINLFTDEKLCFYIISHIETQYLCITKSKFTYSFLKCATKQHFSFFHLKHSMKLLLCSNARDVFSIQNEHLFNLRNRCVRFTSLHFICSFDIPIVHNSHQYSSCLQYLNWLLLRVWKVSMSTAENINIVMK